MYYLEIYKNNKKNSRNYIKSVYYINEKYCYFSK